MIVKGILSYWHLDLNSVIIAILLSLLYFLLAAGKLQKGASTFFSGILIMVTIESSPLHFLGMHYLFSAHMIVHIVLLLICSPLLVLGLPVPALLKENDKLYKFSNTIKHYPWISWLAGIGIMWFWHIPGIFDSAFPDMHASISAISLLHTATMLLAGALFSWPLLGPLPAHRITPPLGVVYLFTACICCSFLGLLITFSPLGIYHHYLGSGTMGFGNVIRNQWGISLQDDQQAAGLIMWVPCCFIYLTGSVYLLAKWFADKEEVSLTTHSATLNFKDTQ